MVAILQLPTPAQGNDTSPCNIYRRGDGLEHQINLPPCITRSAALGLQLNIRVPTCQRIELSFVVHPDLDHVVRPVHSSALVLPVGAQTTCPVAFAPGGGRHLPVDALRPGPHERPQRGHRRPDEAQRGLDLRGDEHGQALVVELRRGELRHLVVEPCVRPDDLLAWNWETRTDWAPWSVILLTYNRGSRPGRSGSTWPPRAPASRLPPRSRCSRLSVARPWLHSHRKWPRIRVPGLDNSPRAEEEDENNPEAFFQRHLQPQ